MKEKTCVCQKCLKEFTVRATYAKYCPECKADAYREINKKHHRSCKVTRKVDTDEMMQMCLSCTKKNCGGECEELASLSRRIGNEKKCTA